MTVEKPATWRSTFKQRRNTVILMAATFFNPLGFDALFKAVMDLTGSYWITDSLFYLASALLFTLYFYLRRNETK